MAVLQAFLALQNGTVVTYDLDRLVLSPYTVPNLWAEYEDNTGKFRKRELNKM